MPKYLDNFKRFVSSIGDLGRYGDTYIVHASKGETVVPTEVLYKNPALKKQLFNTMRDMGIEPERYIVGNELNSINPVTGQAEFFGHKRFIQRFIPKEIYNPISSVTESIEKAADKFVNPIVDFVDEDILDPAGEALEEQILDPAGEFLGEEIAQPLRRQISKAMPDELQFLSGIGGGKLGAYLAALATGNPFLIAAAAAAGNVAGDYLTTEVDEEYDPDVVSAAFSAITQGLAAAEAPSGVPGIEVDGQYVAPTVDPGAVGVQERLMFDPSTPMGTTPTYLPDFRVDPSLAGAPNITLQGADVYGQGGDYISSLGANAPGYAESVAAASKANEAASFAEALTQGTLEAGTGTALEGARNLGIEFVRGAQPYVDPFTAEAGTVRDILSGGATGMDAAAQIAGATAKAFVPGVAELGTKLGIEAVEAAKEAERAFEDYKRRLGISREQTLSDARRLRRQYYIQSFKNFGYSDAEIADVLLRSGLIDTIEDYDPTDLPQDRQFGEDVTNDTLYAAKGGRVGFSNGSRGFMGRQAASALAADQLKQNDMEIANYLEGQKVREKMMDKMKRGLGAMEMNMKLNDPGLFGRIRNVLNPMDNEMGFYTNEETSFPDTKRRYQNMIRNMDQDRAAADYEMRDKMTLVEDYMNRLNTMEMGMATGGIPRVRNAMGTRTTSEGDPISPDMPDGMQMDLRGGGFIPLGTKPKADDIPAMVGKNEFVLNDEAVSGIGKILTGRPDPRAGARALYKLQNEMEAIV